MTKRIFTLYKISNHIDDLNLKISPYISSKTEKSEDLIGQAGIILSKFFNCQLFFNYSSNLCKLLDYHQMVAIDWSMTISAFSIGYWRICN